MSCRALESLSSGESPMEPSLRLTLDAHSGEKVRELDGAGALSRTPSPSRVLPRSRSQLVCMGNTGKHGEVMAGRAPKRPNPGWVFPIPVAAMTGPLGHSTRDGLLESSSSPLVKSFSDRRIRSAEASALLTVDLLNECADSRAGVERGCSQQIIFMTSRPTGWYDVPSLHADELSRRRPERETGREPRFRFVESSLDVGRRSPPSGEPELRPLDDVPSAYARPVGASVGSGARACCRMFFAFSAPSWKRTSSGRMGRSLPARRSWPTRI